MSKARLEYMKHEYSKYWITAREKIYGTSQYDQDVMHWLSEVFENSGKILDVAVGTGEPFAPYFQERGYEVYGVDIAQSLVAKCKEDHPQLHSLVGNAEHLPFCSGAFDYLYCLHSSWYIPDWKSFFEESLRVLNAQGKSVVDIMNGRSPLIIEAHQKALEQLQAQGKEPYEVAYDPLELFDFLNDLEGASCRFFVYSKNDPQPIQEKAVGTLEDYPRILVEIEKCPV